MASFPVYQSQGDLRLPDPRNSVVDWSGAVDNVISKFIEARKLGMQQELNDHTINIANQRLENDKLRLQTEMSRDALEQTQIRANMVIAQDTNTQMMALRRAQELEANAKAKRAQAELDAGKRDRPTNQGARVRVPAVEVGTVLLRLGGDRRTG
jgi:hypothetical protein